MITLPTTIEEARTCTYGALPWRKARYVNGRCAYEVWARGRAFHAYQCARKAGHGPAGLYCQQHARRAGG